MATAGNISIGVRRHNGVDGIHSWAPGGIWGWGLGGRAGIRAPGRAAVGARPGQRPGVGHRRACRAPGATVHSGAPGPPGTGPGRAWGRALGTGGPGSWAPGLPGSAARFRAGRHWASVTGHFAARAGPGRDRPQFYYAGYWATIPAGSPFAAAARSIVYLFTSNARHSLLASPFAGFQSGITGRSILFVFRFIGFQLLFAAHFARLACQPPAFSRQLHCCAIIPGAGRRRRFYGRFALLFQSLEFISSYQSLRFYAIPLSDLLARHSPGTGRSRFGIQAFADSGHNSSALPAGSG